MVKPPVEMPVRPQLWISVVETFGLSLMLTAKKVKPL